MLVLDQLQFEVDKELNSVRIFDEGAPLITLPLDDINELISWLRQAKWTIQGDI